MSGPQWPQKFEEGGFLEEVALLPRELTLPLEFWDQHSLSKTHVAIQHWLGPWHMPGPMSGLGKGGALGSSEILVPGGGAG